MPSHFSLTKYNSKKQHKLHTSTNFLVQIMRNSTKEAELKMRDGRNNRTKQFCCYYSESHNLKSAELLDHEAIDAIAQFLSLNCNLNDNSLQVFKKIATIECLG